MGRPLNSRFFGNFADSGLQLQVEAWVPGAGSSTTNAYVVRQRTNLVYEVTDGSNTGECTLQPDAITAEGQMRVSVSPFGGGTEYVRILNAHDVKTWAGNTYQWTPADEAAAESGEADVNLS
jgi:hypothetical protein